MNKQKYFIVFTVLLLGLGFSVCQYFQTLKADYVSATSTIPNPGHALKDIECNSNSLCIDTVNNRLGVGTVSPSQKLEVNGNILASGSGDVCNGAGKCLSSVFQTNVIVGSNATCPTGQTIIMKAYNGTWYTADNASITSWNKVSCGLILSADGTPVLVNNQHTSKNCADAGGTVVSDGTYSFCRFNASSCSGTWTRYQNWTTTGPTITCQCSTYAACQMNGSYMPFYCSGPCGHTWANNSALETCTTPVPTGNSGCWGSWENASCSATAAVSQIGCY